MPSRQDQLHSYQYSLQRVVAALVTHDPDPSRSPLRRAGTTALVSLLIASLAVGGAAIYGLLTGHSNVDPTSTDVVFQEKGSGARYVYLDTDKRLHPVLNYTSGLLLAGGQPATLKSISADKLAAVPLGAPLGIPDAPDSLPPSDALLTARWSICTDNQGADNTPRSTLLVGYRLTDGTVAARAGRALLVREPAGRTSVVFDNRRFGIPAGRVDDTLLALGWGSQRPWQVAAAWANAVPAGPDLVAPRIAGAGDRSQIGDFRVGQLVTDSGQQFAVILPDGKSLITPMQARLMQAAGAAAPVRIGNQLIALPQSKTRLSDAGNADGLPADVPALADTTPGRACMTLPVDAKAGDGVRIDPTVPPDPAAVATGAVASGSVLADYVHVARGAGVVAATVASPSAPSDSGTVSIVTDTGRGYPLADRALLAKLGYGDVKPQPIPAELISLLPRGPSLDAARARQADVQ